MVRFLDIVLERGEKIFECVCSNSSRASNYNFLFYIIFTISVDRNYLNSENYIFSEFLAPGLVCMAIMQNAFANTSSSILISKVQGNIVDVLMPPLSEYELTFSYSLGGVTSGLLVGLSVSFVIYLIVPLQINNLNHHHLFCLIFLTIIIFVGNFMWYLGKKI